LFGFTLDWPVLQDRRRYANKNYVSVRLIFLIECRNSQSRSLCKFLTSIQYKEECYFFEIHAWYHLFGIFFAPVWAQFPFPPNFQWLSSTEQEIWHGREAIAGELPYREYWLREWRHGGQVMPAVYGFPLATPGNHALTVEEPWSPQAIIEDFQVNENAGDASQYDPKIAVNGKGHFVVVWYDYRNGDSDIYAQRYASDGAPLGPNFRVNDDNGSASQWYPTISMDANGNFVIVWLDWRNRRNIYAQRYTSDGTPLGANFKVNDENGNAWIVPPAVSMDANGNFVIVWLERRNNKYVIYAQRYAVDGSPIGPNFKVNEDSSRVFYFSPPSISLDNDGNFVVVWEVYRNGDWDIYAQRYASLQMGLH